MSLPPKEFALEPEPLNESSISVSIAHIVWGEIHGLSLIVVADTTACNAMQKWIDLKPPQRNEGGDNLSERSFLVEFSIPLRIQSIDITHRHNIVPSWMQLEILLCVARIHHEQEHQNPESPKKNSLG